MIARTLLPALLLAGCATTPPLPRGHGDDIYRAIGTEPFWSLNITATELVFNEANTALPITQPKPRPIIGVAGEIYQTPRINVNIVHARCSDGMSDRIYPDKVQVRIDDRAFEGCGGEPMAPSSLAGSSWNVESVNGRRVPGGERFSMSFEANRMTARFGCNGMSGSYRVDGAMLVPGALAATRMACPDMSWENQASRVLSAPARMQFIPDDKLLLDNAAGTILLKRGY